VLRLFAAFGNGAIKVAGTWSPAGEWLKERLVYPSSPLAFLASLQTSIFQARNRTTGAVMSNIRQSDVKNHLSPRFRTKIHLCEPASQPDATGFSGTEPEATNAEPSIFAKDFVVDHSLSGVAVTPVLPVAVSVRPEAASDSKRAQA